MQATSPLGQYAAPAAAIVSVGIVAAYVVSLFLPAVTEGARVQLGQLALLAIGAVLGSSVAVNGYKAPLNAAHARIDRLQSAVEVSAGMPGGPSNAATVANILEDGRSSDTLPAQAGGGG